MSYREFRRALRLEVSGDVTTRLEGLERVVELRDIGPGGFQIASPVPLAPETIHQVTFTTRDGWTTTLTARCVHVRRLPAEAAPPSYAIGFAFVFPAREGTEQAIACLIDKLTAVLSFE